MLRATSSLSRNTVMQKALLRSATNGGYYAFSNVEQQRFNNSFMKAVMDQVKKDMDKNEDLKKAYDDLQKAKKDRTGPTFADQMKEQAEKLQKEKEKFSESFSEKSSTFKSTWDNIKEENQKAIDETPALKKVADIFGAATGAVSSGFKTIFSGAQKAASVLSKDEEMAKQRNEDWKKKRDQQRTAEEAEEKARKEAEQTGEAYPEAPYQDGIVLRHETSWERFNSKLHDMPFMSKLNAVGPSFFGQTELGKALTKQKELDPSFSYPVFVEQVQHLVTRRVVEAYLLEDSDFLEAHCVNSAKTSFKNSIKERRMLKVHFDESILKWETAELLGGMISEDPEDGEKPVFIWSVECQQVNCLRNDKGEIVEGAEDDIRAVTYALTVRSHHDLTKPNVEFPYEISEFTMLSSKPVIV